MSKVYLLTHGEVHRFVDPIHTQEGMQRLRTVQIPRDVQLIVSGTGKRHIETKEVVQGKLRALGQIVQVQFSIFCGGPESYPAPNTVLLTWPVEVQDNSQFVGINNPIFDMWQFLDFFDNCTLFCAGKTLMIALGLRDWYQPACLYEIYTHKRTISHI